MTSRSLLVESVLISAGNTVWLVPGSMSVVRVLVSVLRTSVRVLNCWKCTAHFSSLIGLPRQIEKNCGGRIAATRPEGDRLACLPASAAGHRPLVRPAWDEHALPVVGSLREPGFVFRLVGFRRRCRILVGGGCGIVESFPGLAGCRGLIGLCFPAGAHTNLRNAIRGGVSRRGPDATRGTSSMDLICRGGSLYLGARGEGGKGESKTLRFDFLAPHP